MLVRPSDNSNAKDYEALIDRLILERVEEDGPDFAQLLVSLPGIYPSTVLERLGCLAKTSQLDDLWYQRIVEDSRRWPEEEIPELKPHAQIHLPVEHPLDYEWRFGQRAAEVLLNQVASLPVSNKPIAMLGTPTVFRHALETRYPRRAVLVDKNPLVADYFAGYPNVMVHNCDVLKDELPCLEASVVIIDPPWYVDHMTTFAWAAVALSATESHMLMSVPPIGTRPNVDDELKQLLSWMQQDLGLTLLRTIKGALPYRTPLFEINALRPEGITNVPREWRKGDLWVLRNGKGNRYWVSRPNLTETTSIWRETALCDVRVKIRLGNCRSTFADPSLGPLVKDDVLPSVSRRDPRRSQVDVWTSGNRVFTCSGTRLLHTIVQALTDGLSPYGEVCAYLQRSLTAVEKSQVGDTIEQVKELVTTERNEISGNRTDAEFVFDNN